MAMEIHYFVRPFPRYWQPIDTVRVLWVDCSNLYGFVCGDVLFSGMGNAPFGKYIGQMLNTSVGGPLANLRSYN